MTAAAALSGLTFQPATSSRTSRKSTAASAAETSASASAGRSAKRSGRSGAGWAGACDGPEEDRDRPRGGHRHLEDEDRPPVEGLGQRATRSRPERGREDGGTQPQAAPWAGAAEEVEDRGQPGRGADRLRAARDEQAREVVGAGARGAGHGEEREAAGADRAHRQRRGGPLERDQSDREDDGVDADDGRDPLDGGVQVAQDVRQRERHDRRVGQAHSRGDGEDVGARGHTRSIEPLAPAVAAPGPNG